MENKTGNTKHNIDKMRKRKYHNTNMILDTQEIYKSNLDQTKNTIKYEN